MLMLLLFLDLDRQIILLTESHNFHESDVKKQVDPLLIYYSDKVWGYEVKSFGDFFNWVFVLDLTRFFMAFVSLVLVLDSGSGGK